MVHFSEEYLATLVNEHKLISACLGRINDRHRTYIDNNGMPAVDAAVIGMKTRKVELEAMIDVLNEFLHE